VRADLTNGVPDRVGGIIARLITLAGVVDQDAPAAVRGEDWRCRGRNQSCRRAPTGLASVGRSTGNTNM
jgi:hypothetical protein